MNCNFIEKERLSLSHCNMSSLMHIEMVNLIDGDYELVPANTIAPESASINFTDLNQDMGQAPEEPKASSAQEGKPRCI